MGQTLFYRPTIMNRIDKVSTPWSVHFSRRRQKIVKQTEDQTRYFQLEIWSRKKNQNDGTLWLPRSSRSWTTSVFELNPEQPEEAIHPEILNFSLHSSHKTPQKILLRICENRFQNTSWIRLLLTTSAATTLDQAAFIFQVFLLLLLCLLFWVYFSLAFTLTFEKLDCVTALHKSPQWLPMTESVLARHNSQLLLQPVLAM